jgi:hypothetical protein
VDSVLREYPMTRNKWKAITWAAAMFFVFLLAGAVNCFEDACEASVFFYEEGLSDD